MAINTVPFGSIGAYEEIIATMSAAVLTSGTYMVGDVVATKAVILVFAPTAATTGRWLAGGLTVGPLTGVPLFLLQTTASIAGLSYANEKQRIELNSSHEIQTFQYSTSLAGLSATLSVLYWR